MLGARWSQELEKKRNVLFTFVSLCYCFWFQRTSPSMFVISVPIAQSWLTAAMLSDLAVISSDETCTPGFRVGREDESSLSCASVAHRGQTSCTPCFSSVARTGWLPVRWSHIASGRAVRRCAVRREDWFCASMADRLPDWLCVCPLHAVLLSSRRAGGRVWDHEDVRGRSGVFALWDSSSGGVSRQFRTCEGELCLSCAALRTVGRLMCCCVQAEPVWHVLFPTRVD